MEVHHHTHTAPIAIERKKWHHYFWEFFMLFLAVTLGFLVENLREHYIEHQREYNYILSLVADLKKDTSFLTGYMSDKEKKEKQMGTLVGLLKSGGYKQHGSDTYYLGRQVTRGISFRNSDGTMQQLKSAGGLRLIRKQYVVDSIMAYDAEVKSLLSNYSNYELPFLQMFVERAGDIFDAGLFSLILDSAGNRSIHPAGNPQLLTNDRIIINKVAMLVQYVWGGERINRKTGEDLRKRAIRLIAFLQNEYHVE